MTARAVAIGLLLGAAADRVLGDPRRCHPVAGFGRAMQAVEARIWRDERRAGVAHAAVGVAIGAAPVWAVDRGLRRRPAARAALTAAVTWSALGGRSLATAGREIGRRVADGDLDGARALAPTLVGRDPATLDAAGLARAGLESVAENTSDAVVAPFVWGALLGAPGVALHRALNTMDAMVGHRSERYARYGWAAARADDVAGWPAARAAALLTVVAAPTVRDLRRPEGPGGATAAWRVWRRDGSRHPSPNAGQVEAAFAGALGVRIGGRNVYGGRTEDRPRLGDVPGARDPDATDLARAARLSLRVGTLAAVVAAAGALVVPRRGSGRRVRPRRCRRPDTAS
ncbi:MAG: cobalamin biosynthesis protein [Patulibacter sp.]|nr:cobalamin biosynthesis protein [Patulibacter sp.]